MHRQLKKLEPYFIIDEDIKLCCMIFFGYVNRPVLRSEIQDYQNARVHDTKKGILLCPECIMEKLGFSVPYKLDYRNGSLDIPTLS